MKKWILPFICVFSLLSGCKKPAERSHSIHFYVWKTTPKLTEKEEKVFEKTAAKNLYVRLFDIVTDLGKPKPQAVLKEWKTNLLAEAFIPVIFITNETFSEITASTNEELAKNTFELIEEITGQYDLDYEEIQIDCDWTESTKDAYFSFLISLKKISQKEVTSTLRLHQVKYRRITGIPPVNKVYLMAYATSSPIADQEVNSILDLDLLKDYLQSINDYPLDFDVALPLYSWAIVSNHLGRKKLINGIAEEDLTHEDFEQKEGRFIAKKDLFLEGLYINEGFEVKIEGISPELLKETKTYLGQKIKKPFAWVYYHLDHRFTDRFTINDLL